MQSASTMYPERTARRLARRSIFAVGAIVTVIVAGVAEAQTVSGCSFRNVGECGSNIDAALETLRRLKNENRSFAQRPTSDPALTANRAYVDSQGRPDSRAAMRAICSYPQQSIMGDPADPQDACAEYRSPANLSAITPAPGVDIVPPIPTVAVSPPLPPSRRPAAKQKSPAAQAQEVPRDPAPALARQKTKPKPPRDIRPVLPR